MKIQGVLYCLFSILIVSCNIFSNESISTILPQREIVKAKLVVRDLKETFAERDDSVFKLVKRVVDSLTKEIDVTTYDLIIRGVDSINIVAVYGSTPNYRNVDFNFVDKSGQKILFEFDIGTFHTFRFFKKDIQYFCYLNDSTAIKIEEIARNNRMGIHKNHEFQKPFLKDSISKVELIIWRNREENIKSMYNIKIDSIKTTIDNSFYYDFPKNCDTILTLLTKKKGKNTWSNRAIYIRFLYKNGKEIKMYLDYPSSWGSGYVYESGVLYICNLSLDYREIINEFVSDLQKQMESLIFDRP